MGLGEGYQQFVLIKNQLKDFVDRRYDCSMIDISEEEINKWRKEQVEAIINNPEIAQILIEMQVQNK